MYGEQSDRAEGDIHSGQVTLRKNDDGGVLRTRAERQMSKLKTISHLLLLYQIVQKYYNYSWALESFYFFLLVGPHTIPYCIVSYRTTLNHTKKC